jgi:hypothetical protein
VLALFEERAPAAGADVLFLIVGVEIRSRGCHGCNGISGSGRNGGED